VTDHAELNTRLLRRPAVTAAGAAAVSAGVALLLFPYVSGEAYAWALTVCLTVAASAVAVVDVRTHTLPNRCVSAAAAAGLVQAAVVSTAAHDGTRFLESLIAAVAVFAVYAILGLVGWFGFGDAKFAGALTVTVAIYAGFAAMYLVPLAIIFAAAGMLFGRAAGRVSHARAHGPAIGLAAVCIMTAAVLGLFAAP
jgi:leader peptidase (prepilin peptidase)/N-methyltransferase